MSEWIAEMPVTFVHPDGTRAPGRIAIARPVPRADHVTCAVALDGLRPSIPSIDGADSLQALLLATQLVGRLLGHFLAKGGRVVYPREDDATAIAGGDDSDIDVPLDGTFGPLLR